MKTKEFIRQVEELGLFIQVGSKATFIRKHDGGPTCVVVDERYVYSFDSLHCSYDDLEDDDKSKLFNLLVEYASTPIEERKEEKKYYIKHKHLGTYCNHLNYDTESSSWAFYDAEKTLSFKTKFTLAELPDWVHTMLEQGHLVKEEVE